MPPQYDDVNTATGRQAVEALNLTSIRKSFPNEVFEKSALKGSMYMFRDYACWAVCLAAMYYVVGTSFWANAPFWQQALVYCLFSGFTGFWMWCVFMIGHDCGHTTFSESELVNDIVGHVTHGSLMVPFYPWQISHRRHHMYHNHEDKDYSHPWFTPEKMALPENWLVKATHETPFGMFLMPFYGWQLYLLGSPDGSHYFPVGEGRIWKEGTQEERNKSWLSLASVIGFLALFYTLSGSFSTFCFYYAGPHLIFCWWLVCVTYLQHHDHDTLVYGDDDWSFVRAAFETVDRTYGWGIDDIHHNISNGHVVHHLFFTKIPHYHLKTATAAMRAYLAEHNLSHLYKHVETQDFFVRLHKYMLTVGYRATRASSVNKKKE